MSYLKITNAGLQYKDEVFAGTEQQNITHFVFANVPGLDPATPISADATIPTTHVVHEEPIKRVAALDGNAVVISCVLGYEIGNFDFNWFGAVATKANGDKVLIGVVQTALQTKTKTVGNNIGNYTVKSIVWQTQNIADSLNITLAALPWQVDGETAFVSKSEFNEHSHDDRYVLKNHDKWIKNTTNFEHQKRYSLETSSNHIMPDTTNFSGGEYVVVRAASEAVPQLTVNNVQTEKFKRLGDNAKDTTLYLKSKQGKVDKRLIVFVFNVSTKEWEFS